MSPACGAVPHRIAVVGTGPRGMMVLERLVARLGDVPPDRPVEILAIDGAEVGAGRVYRTDQPDWFLMNTVVGQISAFSGLPDPGPARPGAGPSFAEWWQATDPLTFPGDDGYAPRATYGRYLRFVLDRVQAATPEHVTLRRISDRVRDLRRSGGRYRLLLDGAGELDCDRVVLATGHSTPEPGGRAARFAAFADAHPGARYLAGDSAADMPLACVGPGSVLGVIGLGLSFYDIVADCTVGRGGRFVADEAGALRYEPSGAEPRIVAGSRSGMPLPPRGHNQKPPTYSYAPVLFRPERVLAGAARARGDLDFRADILPWLLAEMDLVHCATALAGRLGPDVRASFVRDVTAALDRDAGTPPDVRALAAAYGPVPPAIDLDALARPFAGRSYAHPAAFEADLVTEARRQLVRAAQGNVDSPIGAALDVMRDTRWVLRSLVDFGGLSPRSHREDFLGWYVPRTAFLAAGPPAARVRELLALVAAGVLRVVGPDTEFLADETVGRFVLRSPHVAHSEIVVDALLDARIPTPDVRTDASPLARNLRRSGVWTSFVNTGADGSFDTGGVAVSPSPFHPVTLDGRVEPGVHVLGIPTEHTRWFTQVGSSRPGAWSDFVHDADDVARSVLRPVRSAVLADA